MTGENGNVCSANITATLSDKSLSVKKGKCKGGKHSKQRITMLILVNAVGAINFLALLVKVKSQDASSTEKKELTLRILLLCK